MPNHERAEDGALREPAALRQSGANPHPEAFLRQAMADWGDAVYRLALGQTRSRADAEDVYQDVFLRLLDSGTAFESPEHLKAWLLRVTINRCRDIGRSGWKRRNEPLAERHAALAVEAPDLLESDIWNAIGTLPPDLRAVVHLHYVEGYSTDEAAALVGCRPSTARTRLHRARKHLKAALETADLAGRPAPCQPAGSSRADDGSAFSRPTSSAFASFRPADNRCASVHPATTDSPSSGKEADHEPRPLRRLCCEDTGGENLRPPA